MDKHPVDALLELTKTDPPSADVEIPVEMATGEYDASFFRDPGSTALEHLADARVGLALFLEEAGRALEKGDLTVDQRVHVATILSYIEGLAKRFDKIRVPGFVQHKRR